jgi:Uma2 family endonuclease
VYLERRDPGNLVMHDVLIKWDTPGMRGHGPDIVAFADVRHKPEWGEFNQAEMGGHPLLAIEVTSRGTRRLDVAPATNDPDAKTKFLHYALVGVPIYIIVDLAKRKKGQAPPILGYQLTEAGAYTPLPLNAQGWLWVEPAGLWLGPYMEKVTWYTPSGQRIGEYEDEQAARRAAEEQIAEERARAEQERARAEQERARAEQLEEELRRLRGEA